jgi:hypothetical protein
LRRTEWLTPALIQAEVYRAAKGTAQPPLVSNA